MPFDLDTSVHSRRAFRQDRDRTAVAAWLLAVCAMLWIMIVLGGATRLTGSGLSIMEWAPVTGALPPVSTAEWQRLFTLYQRIPQYELVNGGMTLAGFQHIFWLEWLHRLWGRLIGVVFLVPLVVFGLRGAIGRRLWLRLFGLFVLGGLQGAVGWFMVASGFAADSTAVSATRLVAHLALALLLYAAILWTALGVLRPWREAVRPDRAFGVALGAAGVLLPFAILAGGLTAGLHAGLIDNSFPLMDGTLLPRAYAALTPFLRNLTENAEAVQFDHRATATATALAVLLAAGLGLRRRQPVRVRRAAAAMGLAVTAQYALGVATLLLVVPVPLAVAHQAVAVLLLTTVLAALHARLHRPLPVPGR